MQAVPSQRAEASAPKLQRDFHRDFLGSLKIRQKFLVVALAFTLPVLVVTGFLINSQNKQISFAAKELEGVRYIVPLRQVFYNIQLHRGRAATQLSGEASAQTSRLALAEQINQSLVELGTLDTRYGAELKSTELFERIRDGWGQLERTLETLTPTESTQRHTELINALSALILQVGNYSNLVLDPDLDSYYVMDLVINKIPAELNSLGLVRTLGIQAASRATNTPEQKTELALRLGSAEADIAAVERDLQFAFEASPFVRAQLGQQAETRRQSVNSIIDSYKNRILNVERVTVTGPQFFDLALDSFTQQHALHESSLNVLGTLLQNRIQSLRRSQLTSLLVITLVVALTFFLAVVVARRISGPTENLFGAAQRLSRGDLSALIPVTSRDELGTLSVIFNDVIKQLRLKTVEDAAELERSRQLQANITSFLDVAMDIGGGDLTKRGVVTEDALGNVVDAINVMIEEFGILLRSAQETAASVAAGSDQMVASSDAISSSAQLQAGEAQRAQSEVQTVVASIQQTAQRARDAAVTALDTLESAEAGKKALDDTLLGMQAIRTQVAKVATRATLLGQSSQEISEITDAISDFASQTNLLALSAALEAAGAGESGRRFAVVAEEVGLLAERSAEAAERITQLVSRIQKEVGGVVSEVEAGVRDVEKGYEVAAVAGRRLGDIATISRQSALVAEAISESTRAQVTGVEQVGKVVTHMAELSAESQTTVLEGREVAARLRRFAEQLTQNLVQFRVG